MASGDQGEPERGPDIDDQETVNADATPSTLGVVLSDLAAGARREPARSRPAAPRERAAAASSSVIEREWQIDAMSAARQ